MEYKRFWLDHKMSPYGGAKLGVGVNYDLPQKLEVKVGMSQVSALLPFLFAVVIDVVNNWCSG